jgi:hypothetical protein
MPTLLQGNAEQSMQLLALVTAKENHERAVTIRG